MRVVVAGASGFVGRELVPLLEREVSELLLVGRSVEKMQELFPNQRCVSYENLSSEMERFDMILCLVTMNNDQAGTIDEFRAVNVQKVVELATIAQNSKVANFIHFSTTHVVALGQPGSSYAQTKLEAETRLLGLKNINVINLRLPAVYGHNLRGKLSALSVFPPAIRRRILSWIGVIQPVVAIESIAAEIPKLQHSLQNTVYLSDDNRRLYLFLKRFMDLSGAIVILLILGWSFPLIWIAVKLDSSGPGIFAQERVGKDKQVFRCYKFRTMFTNTLQGATHQVSASAVTRVGGWLRATKLDELPQIVNIFQNSMSLVGPRPCLPQQTELISHREKLQVFDVSPGITGLAQIRHVDMSRPEMLAELDSDYIHTRSLLLDLKILLATALGRGSGDHVAAKDSPD